MERMRERDGEREGKRWLEGGRDGSALVTVPNGPTGDGEMEMERD